MSILKHAARLTARYEPQVPIVTLVEHLDGHRGSPNVPAESQGDLRCLPRRLFAYCTLSAQ
jgi:hypothetical protein